MCDPNPPCVGRSIWLLPAVIAGISALLYLAVFNGGEPDVHVTVINHGSETLRAVAVEVTGRVHTLGDMPPGRSERRKSLPTGPTGVAIEYGTDAGKRVRLDADGSFQPGDRGEVIIELRDGRIAASWFNLIEGG